MTMNALLRTDTAIRRKANRVVAVHRSQAACLTCSLHLLSGSDYRDIVKQ
jgi:hypothetical protein